MNDKVRSALEARDKKRKKTQVEQDDYYKDHKDRVSAALSERSNRLASDVDEEYVDKFLSDMNSFYSSVDEDFENIGWSNASSLYDSKDSAWQDLSSRSSKVRAWLTLNKDKFDSKTFDGLVSSLNDFGTKSTSVLDKFKEQKNYYGQFKSEDEYNRYVATQKFTEDALSAEDFADNSGYVSTKNDKWWAGLIGKAQDDTYEYINDVDGARSDLEHKHTIYSSDNIWDDGVSMWKEKGYDQLNEDEKAAYNYYYATGGKKKAEEYLDAIQENLNYRRANEEFGKMKDNTALELLFGVEAGLDQFSSGIKNAFNFKDDYIPVSATQLASGMVREDLADNGFKVFGNSLGQVGYDLVNTTSNMLPSILASTAANFVAPGSGAVIGAGLMGTSASGNAYQEMLNLGYDKGQARAYSTLVGISEAGLQYALGGISKLGGKATNNFISKAISGIDNGLARFAIDLGGKLASEGIEEGLQEVINPLLKNAVLHADEDIDWSQVAYSSLLGSLSALGLEGVGTTASHAQYNSALKAEGNSIVNSGGVESLVALANEMAGVSDTDVANSLSKRVSNVNGKNGVNAKAVGKLSEAVNETRSQLNKTDIVTALEGKGVDSKKAQKYADALVSMNEEYFAGEKSAFELGTTAQWKKITGDENAYAVLREVVTDMESSVNARNKKYGYARQGINVAEDGTLSNTDERTKKVEESILKPAYAKKAEDIDVAVSKDGKAKVVSTDAEGVSTDTEVTINGIDRIVTKKVKGEDGKTTTEKVAYLKVTDADGNESVVDWGGVEFGSRQDAVLYETFVAMDADPAHFDAYVKNFNEADYNADLGEAAIQYALGFQNAYRYGWANMENELGANVYASKLTESARNIAYTLGKETVSKKTEAKQSALDTAVAERKASGKGKARTKGKLHMDANTKATITNGELTGMRKAGVELAKRLTSIGLDVYLYESHKDDNGNWVDENGKEAENGFYVGKSGEIHIDLNAGVSGNGIMVYTLAHEVTHFIRDFNPREFKILADFVIEHYGKKGMSVAEQITEIMVNENVNWDTAYEELVAKSCESFFTDSNIVERIIELKQKDKRTWERLRDKVLDFIKWMRSVMSGHDPESKQGKLFHQWKGEIDHIYDAFTNALSGAIDTYQAVGSMTAEETKAVEAFGKDLGTVERNENGEMLVATNKDGSTLMYSIRTWKNGGKAKLIETLNALGHGDRAQEYAKYLDDAIGYLQDLAVGYEILGQHLDANIVTDIKNGKQVLFSLVNNGEYPVNIDLALICKKRVAYMRLMAKMIEDGVFGDVKYDGDAIAEVNKILRKNGFETACLGCFVESRRLQFQTWAETIVQEWNEAVEARNKYAHYFRFADGKASLTDAEIEALDKELATGGKKNDKGNLNLGQGSVAAKMSRLLDKVPSLARKLTVDDLLTPQGLTALRATDSNLFSLVKQRYGAASPKIVQDYSPYASEIANLTFDFVKKVTGNNVKGAKEYILEAKKELGVAPKKDKSESKGDFAKRKAEYDAKVEALAMQKYLYSIGGTRIQSFSDFMIENVFDYLQIFADLAAKELPMHGYTKEIVALRLFGMSGAKWNGSLIARVEKSMGKEYAGLLPASEAKNGNGILVKVDGKDYCIAFDDYARNKATNGESFIQSIGMKDIIALMYDPRYSPYVGNITIGVSDKQILAMLDSPLFRMVIPYHASGMLPQFAQLVGVDMYNDYTNYQNTTVKTIRLVNDTDYKVKMGDNGKPKIVKKADGKDVGIDTHYPFNEMLQKYGDARKTCQDYLAWCRNEHPIYDKGKVIGYATFNAKFSDSPTGVDFTKHRNYYKLIEDFNTYDNITEQPTQQGAVTMNFPSAENRLTAEQKSAYAKALRDTGIFTEADIKKYLEKADMTFEEIVREEVGNRKAYQDATEPKFDSTVKEVEDYLLNAKDDKGDYKFRRDSIADTASDYIEAKKHGISLKPATGSYMGDAGVKRSVRNIVGPSGTNYGLGVYLDSTLLDNLTDAERVTMVKEYVKELGGSVFTAYDPNGNAVDVHIVESAKRFKNKSGKRVPVNKDMTQYLKSVKQEAIVLVDELITVSSYEESKPSTYPHDWLDNYGKNDWEYWTVYIQEKNNSVWEATLNIANSENGEKILYDIVPIKMVEQSITLDTSTTEDSITQDSTKSQDKKSSRRESKGRELTEAQQEFFKDSKVRDADGNLVPVYHGTPTGGFTTFEMPHYLSTLMSAQGAGFYFTDEKNAKQYMKPLNGKVDKNRQLYEVYLNITNPMEITPYSNGHITDQQMRDIFARGNYEWGVNHIDVEKEIRINKLDSDRLATLVKVFNGDAILDAMKEVLGYDGVRFTDQYGDVWVAWEQSQIKSTTNTNPTKDPDIRYQRRGNSTSNRSLLANALEGAAQNDIEARRLAEYRSKIDLINAEEEKLREVRARIAELSFSKGPKDTAKIKSLQETATRIANRINTYDKQLLRLEATAPLKAVLEREKTALRKQEKQRMAEAVAQYRERAADTLREVMKHNAESRKRASENRHKTEVRHKIKSVVSELNQLLLNGTRDKHVKIDLQKATAEALSAINMDTVNAEKRLEEIQRKIDATSDPDKIAKLQETYDRIEQQGENMMNKLTALKSAYEEIKDSSDPLVANAYHPEIEERIKNLRKEVGDTPLREMSLEQLENVYDTYRMVLHTIRTANKAFKADKAESISTLANRTMEEVHTVGGTKTYRSVIADFFKKFYWNGLKPVFAFKAIGSGTLSKMFDSVRAGEDTWAVDVSEAKEYYKGVSKKYNYDSWDFNKQYTFKSKTGKEFSLSIEQIMSLYAYSKRKQADEHLEKGGFVFDEAIEVIQKKHGIPVKYRVNVATSHNLSRATLGEIVATLSDEQKAFVDEMQAYLSDVMGAKGNEVSLEMFGVKLFKERFYFPLKSAKQFMYEQNEVAGEVRLKNSGFSKETVAHANNPIILSNFMDVWANHVNDMSMYHAFVLPLEDFNRVFNYKTPTTDDMDTESVKMYIQNAYGSHPVQYVKQLLTDLNGGARTDPSADFITKMTGLFKKSAVFASASVVVQQPSSIARAASMIDNKYFLTKLSVAQHKAEWAEVKKYAPVAIIKEMGYFDTHMGRSTTDFIKAKEYDGVVDKMKGLVTDSGYRDEALSKAPAVADELAWCYIWNAVKKEVADTTDLKVGSEEFLQKCGERFTEVVVNTQVYDSVLSRSAMMRSKDTGMKMVTAFMAEPTTSINMIADAIIQGKRGNKKGAAKTIGAVAASLIINSILVSLVYAGRDDDEDKTYTEKYIGTLTGELIDSFNPLTMIPFVKDMISIAQGYDVERSDMAVISDLFTAIKKLSNDKLSAYRKVEDFGGAIASIFGLPAKNIMRDVRAVYNTIFSFASGEYTTGAGIGHAVKETVTGKAVSDANQLYNAIISGDKAHEARVKSRLNSASKVESALREGLRENDPRIHEAAKARYDGDVDEYMRIAREIKAEGHFSQDTIVAAINAEINKLKPDEESEPNSPSVVTAEDYYKAIVRGEISTADSVKEELIAQKVAEGYTTAEAEDSVASGFVAQVKTEYMDGTVAKAEAIDLVDTYGGDAVGKTKVKEWDFETEVGYSWGQRDNAYRLGVISKNELISYIMDIEGEKREDAVNKVRVFDFKTDYPEYSDVSSEAIEKFYEPIDNDSYNLGYSLEETGMDIDVYAEYVRLASKCKGVDKNKDGKADSGTVKAEKLRVINSLPLTRKQKDALYYLNGWTKKDLYKAPWH